jgi:hypothetical protein
VIRAYCDESYDGQSRIYTIAGFAARDKEWARAAKAWKIRCLQDAIQCYHSADCDGGYGDFKALSKERIVALNTDLIDVIVGVRLFGFATCMILESRRAVSISVVSAATGNVIRFGQVCVPYPFVHLLRLPAHPRSVPKASLVQGSWALR